MLRPILVLVLVFLKRDVDEGEESEVHLRVALKVASVVLDQLVQGH